MNFLRILLVIWCGLPAAFGQGGAVFVPRQLKQLSDITITTPSSGQVLKFDGTKWVNSNASVLTSLGTLTSLNDGGQLILSGRVDDTLSANPTDYAPTGILTATHIFVDCNGADRTVNGLTGGVGGRILGFTNKGAAGSLILAHNSGTAGNKFTFPAGGNVTLPPDGSIEMRYDGTAATWRPWGRALSNTGVTAASYGSATAIPVITFDLQGRATSASTAALVVPAGTLTGLGTGVATALGTAVVGSGSIVLNGGNSDLNIASTRTTQTAGSGPFSVIGNSLTTGSLAYLSSSSVTTGNLLDIRGTSAGTGSPVGLNIALSGATSGTNTGLTISSTLGSTNKAINVTAGSTTLQAMTASSITLPINGATYIPTLDLGGGKGLLADASTVVITNGSTFLAAWISGNSLFQTSLVPNATAAYNLGTSALRWNNVFGVNGNFSGTLAATGATTLTGDVTTASKVANTMISTTLGAAVTTFVETNNFIKLTGAGGGNTISTITGGVAGQTLTLLFVDALVTITDTAAATANTVDLSAAFTSTANDTITLIFDGNKWFEVSRSTN